MAAPRKVKIGIIGGSGLDDPDILSDRKEITCSSSYGSPSDCLIEGKIKDVDCVLLARHGRKHNIMPSNVNYRANIFALKEQGCTHIVVTNACGSLKEEIKPGDIIFPDQFIDRTTKRESTFYDGKESSLKGVCHIPMHTPFCPETRQILIKTAKELKIPYHESGTIVVIEGPRFSTKAESHLFRSWKCDIIGMTTVPEVVLANELGICYATIAMATDYDCWRDDGASVCVEDVMATMKNNAAKATHILLKAIPAIAEKDWTDVWYKQEACAKSAVML
ncbi:S-methyl-5'-thioadenosine phosphorylase-like [Argiope bruennichi]|uniref:S-methyl-5'-thioadenosine phosphorylase n=1 Tax=Argiope bruennichi TaxID=94029 RepID=A0A8T0F8D6_ARGBR|nr:S-methyl-5'-thioadenosine phosphorylase-like [Argiope bruennichi]KAF8787457.1 S-methyl-5'-thioadenosine phosphorylase like protein [Argiope bruennichi]